MAKKSKSTAQPPKPSAVDGDNVAVASLDHKSLLEHARFTNAYVTDYIKFADAKAGAITAGSSAGLAALGALANTVLSKPALECGWHVIAIICAVLGGLVLLGSVAFALMSLIPRVQASSGSLFSFPDICKRSLPDYVASLCGLDDRKALDQLSSQNHTLCVVLNTKFVHQKNAVMCLLGSLLPLSMLAVVQIAT